ncbi:MAG: serine/threonine-protein kinase [Polyangiaceae bacterium]
MSDPRASKPTTVEALASSWASREGSTFADKFQIQQSIGTGGMGAVYKAVRLSDQHPVALKVIHRHLVSNTQVTRRFLREAAILGTLKGEHLVPLIESGEDNEGRLYMALELVDGIALDQQLSRHGAPSIPDSVDIAIQVCRALKSAHEQGVVHRDLKPANVLLEPMPNGRHRVRVFDFGLAKVLRESGIGTSQLTEQNMIFGTPEYMAPEQVKGDVPDERCDIYAAGVMLYEMLTGHVPFSEHTGVATMTAHLTGTLIPPRLRAPERGISAALEAVTLYAMSRSREGRYPTAASLEEALLKALEHPHAISAMRPPPPLDIATSDTLMSSKQSNGIDPLGATAPFVASDPRLALLATPAQIRVSPALMQTAQVTPEQLQGSAESRPWLWLIVGVVAAAIGIIVGVLVAT